MKIEQRCQTIELILADVDGVLTGGGIVFDNQGIETKQFHIRDGLGIRLWQCAGYRFGLVTVRIAAPLALAVWKPPPGMLAALQRDLHITVEQAQARLLNEARFTPIEAQLHRRLGDRFAGSWLIGSTSQILVVATTDPADLPQITAMGARGEVVGRSLARLDATLKEVDTALATHPNGRVRSGRREDQQGHRPVRRGLDDRRFPGGRGRGSGRGAGAAVR